MKVSKKLSATSGGVAITLAGAFDFVKQLSDVELICVTAMVCVYLAAQAYSERNAKTAEAQLRLTQ